MRSTEITELIDLGGLNAPPWSKEFVHRGATLDIQTHPSETPGIGVRAWTASLRLPAYALPSERGLDWSVTYGKPLIEPGRLDPVGGSCPEVEVAQLLREGGWDAWWSDGYGQAPARWRPWIRRAKAWQGSVGTYLARVQAARIDGKAGGVPDVIATQGSQTALIECKGNDKFKKSQLGWLRAARLVGIAGRFMVCQVQVE